jgi:hypothetical protein
MAFTVENGTGLAGANAYISADDADDYHEMRRNTAWDDLDDDEKEAAILKATDYMDAAYSWAGDRSTSTQALGWPRSGVVADGVSLASDELPAALVRACAELALRASSSDLAPDVPRLKSREKVGPIEVEYDPHARAYTTYRLIDSILAPLLAGASGVFRTVVRT